MGTRALAVSGCSGAVCEPLEVGWSWLGLSLQLHFRSGLLEQASKLQL